MDEERKVLIIPEKGEIIDAMKNETEVMQQDDPASDKIRKLEIANKILKVAATVVGIATAVNFVVPDMVPFVDEALLTGITALLGTSTKIVENKIDDLAKTGSTKVQGEEVKNLVNDFDNVFSQIKAKKRKK